MTSLSDLVYFIPFGLRLAALCAGLIVSYRFRRLSPRMWLVIAGFTMLCGTAGITFAGVGPFTLLGYLVSDYSIPGLDVILGFVYVAAIYFVEPLAWVFIVIGLGLVWRELHKRIQQLRGLLAERSSLPTGLS